MVGAIISLGAVILSLISLLLSRKDKSNKDTEDDGYKWGKLDEKISNIDKTLTKLESKFDSIESKFDSLDKEVDEKIEKAILVHVESYHKRGRKSQ